MPGQSDVSRLIEVLQSSIKRALDEQAVLRPQIDSLKTTQTAQQEQIRVMSEELKELKQDLKEAKQAILESQESNYKRIIYVQGTLLLAILGAVIGLAVKVFFH